MKKSIVKAIVAGLGNPSLECMLHRRNVGFMAMDRIMGRHCRFPLRAGLGHGGYITGMFDQFPVLCIKPMAGMSCSGLPMIRMAESFPGASILVVHDDMRLPFGVVRKLDDDSPARNEFLHEHRGVKSLESQLGEGFSRIHIGIGMPIATDLIEHLLGDFTPEEIAGLSGILEVAEMEVLQWVYSVLNKDPERAP